MYKIALIIFMAALLATKHLGDYNFHYSYDGYGSYSPLWAILTYWLPFKDYTLIFANMINCFLIPYIILKHSNQPADIWLYSGPPLILSALWYMPQALAINIILIIWFILKEWRITVLWAVILWFSHSIALFLTPLVLLLALKRWKDGQPLFNIR